MHDITDSVLNSAEQFHSGSWGGRFVVIDTIALGVAFGDITHLVAYDIPSVVSFALADKFAFQWMPVETYYCL